MSRLFMHVLSLFAVILLLSCAQQVAPSGGPDDLSPPNLMQSVPALGATSVPEDISIRFMFSEWINPGSAKRSVTMYPPVEDGLRIQVSGRALTIRPRQALMDSTTYHVTLTTTLEDLHGNPLATSIDLYFSTGPQLDSGMVYGCIPVNEKYELRPTVALYRKDTIPTDSLLFLPPTYVTQTDSLGAYSFSHIRPDSYELFAFVDRDNNSRFSLRANETVFAPVRQSIRVDSTVGPLMLFPTSGDTSAITIDELQPKTAQMLFARWSDMPFFPMTTTDTLWQIISTDTAAKDMPSIESIQPIHDGRSMFISLDSPMELVPYQLIYPALSRTDTNTFFADTIRFNGTTVSDTVSPALIDSEPDSNSNLRPVINLVWSEPVRLRLMQVELTSSLDTIILPVDTSRWTDTISFTPPQTLQPQTRYNISIPVEHIIDIAANSPVDTADTISPGVIDFSFTTLPIDSICLLLQGGAPCLEKDLNRIWLFRPLEAQTQYVSNDSSGLFRFDSIPAGEGTIAYFIDLNEDNLHTQGRLFPWLAPEPFFSFTDTIEARALWEIEGVRVNACRVCPPPDDSAEGDVETPADTAADLQPNAP
ncbi:MAG: Ig-like domain-containing protein [Chitinivibrionales bacterium]